MIQLQVNHLAWAADESLRRGGERVHLRSSEARAAASDGAVTATRLSIGVAGCSAGIVTGAVMGPCRWEDPQGRLVVVAATSRSSERAEAFARSNAEHPIAQFSYQLQSQRNELVEFMAQCPSPVLYVPMIPCGAKHRVCLEALSKGVNVLAEKPFMTNARETYEFIDEYRRLCEIRQQHGLPPTKMMIGVHSYTHHSHNILRAIIRRSAADGKFCLGSVAVNIGQLDSMQVRFDWPKTPEQDARIFDPAGGGAVLDLGVYCIALVHEILDELSPPRHDAGSP